MGDKLYAVSNFLVALAGVSAGILMLLAGAAALTGVVGYAFNKGWL